MHIQARDFTVFIKSILSEYFSNKRVLDVGSGDINGNNRFLFENCEYNGNDVVSAPNVTIVSKTKDLPFEDNFFDTIISTECFEHDPEYKASLIKIYSMLKPGGLFCFTCASTGRAEHGTRRTNPKDSFGTMGNLLDMIDYYKNLTDIDVNDVLNFNELFSSCDTYYNAESNDLYFVGIKKNILNNNITSLPKYINYLVECTASNTKILNSLDTIFDKYDTDKKRNFHNYTRQYETLLKDFKNKPIKYLEIGVYNGGSLNAMREVFENSSCILGLDINHNCKIYEDVKNNIYVEIGDATDSNFINNIINKYGKFDIILDDGSHRNCDVIKTFEWLFPLLNDDGLYIVEDTICCRDKNFIDSNYPNHLEYFFKYTLFLNQCRYDSHYGIKDNCVDPFKILKKTTNVFEYSIDKIEYGCSYIAIHKKIRYHWI
jgi:SAM-dependent methyltransferase